MRRASALLMALVLVLYLVLAGWRAVEFMRIGSAASITMGIALLVFPLFGVWFIYRELRFGWSSARIVNRAQAEGIDLSLGISVSASGRVDRADALAHFLPLKATVEAQPESWWVWLRLGIGYNAAGDRRRARFAIGRAIKLERGSR